MKFTHAGKVYYLKNKVVFRSIVAELFENVYSDMWWALADNQFLGYILSGLIMAVVFIPCFIPFYIKAAKQVLQVVREWKQDAYKDDYGSNYYFEEKIKGLIKHKLIYKIKDLPIKDSLKTEKEDN